MKDTKKYNTRDLILKVNDDIDAELEEWDDYLECLCLNRDYQKNAIKIAISYLISGDYSKIEDLIDYNWNQSETEEIKNRYSNIDKYFRNIQLPEKLAANIDLATGTGKSYVIYGIAQIMLSMGYVDKVLVLCPSITIEIGLTDKFIELSGNSKLRNLIPKDCTMRNPRIVNGNSTVIKGDICIENIHAVYSNNKSSISESFIGKGDRVIVLNDESHHIYNIVLGTSDADKSIKKWKEFLLNKEYNFKYILGFTGTAYIENEYFNDVIFRYSLKRAIEDQVIKMIEYVSEDDSSNETEKFEKIYENHEENKRNYEKIKPISLLVTNNIQNAKKLETRFKEYLINNKKMELSDVENKVLVITSSKEHEENLEILKSIDSKNNSYEWLISVSMLTEGWDVKNVFQIIPCEERAFNSKLLIAQVIGRGLRIPQEYSIPQPKVRVFNHSSFSKNIKTLVDEVLEIENKLCSHVLNNDYKMKYNFEIYNINYEKEFKEKETSSKNKELNYKGTVKLDSQVEWKEKETEYTDIRNNRIVKKTIIAEELTDVEDIAKKLYEELKFREWESKYLNLPNGTYEKENLPSIEEIKNIIYKSMDEVGIKGTKLNKENKNRVLTMFSTLLRKNSKTLINISVAKEYEKICTSMLPKESISINNFRKDTTVFYTKKYKQELLDENLEIFQEFLEDGSFRIDSRSEIKSSVFKTPTNLVFTQSEPEKLFVKKLFNKKYAQYIDSWIKSRNTGFYSINYTLTSKGGRHSKTKEFNPDFFIKINKDNIDNILVVEIKEDKDVNDINKAKYKSANQHFKELNSEMERLKINQKYYFNFLSPNSYIQFFEYISNGKLLEGKFRSNLDNLLDDNM